MEQPRIRNLANLFAAGTKASAGAGQHGVALSMTICTKAVIDSELNSFELLFDEHQAATADLSTLIKALGVQRKAASEFVFAARDSMKRKLGRKYSTAWEGTGFNRTLQVPTTVARLQLVMRSLQSYLEDHPAFEVEDAVTADIAETTLTALTDAQTAVDLQESVVGTLLTKRRKAEKQLRLRVRWLVDELSRLLDPMDDRWTAFGLNKPGQQKTPNRPANVIVKMSSPTAMTVEWDKSPRARYYRIWLKVIGVDAEPVPVGSPADLHFLLEDLPSGSEVEVSVSAVNDGGESARSEVVRVPVAVP